METGDARRRIENRVVVIPPELFFGVSRIVGDYANIKLAVAIRDDVEVRRRRWCIIAELNGKFAASQQNIAICRRGCRVVDVPIA